MTPLRIGIDARELIGQTTGVGRYLGELLQRWIERPDSRERRLLLYSPEPPALSIPANAADWRVVGRGRGTWWEQTALRQAVRQDRPDVFFAPAYTAPLGAGVRLCVTIHDISFVVHPEWFKVTEGLRRRWLTRRAAHTAAVIFTDSQFSRAEIEQHLHADPSRIHVIPPGVTPRHAHVTGPRQPLVLFVGSLFNRRRLPDLIAAFARATADLPDARLVIVGDNRTWPPLDLVAVARSAGVESRTEFMSYVDDGRLAELYGQASVFAFLSEYEGFGLTPLEALGAGVPVVVLDTAVAREVYGGAALYVPQGDIGATADALQRLLRDPRTASPQLAEAPAVLARYSWDRAADETLRHLTRVARGE